ncbi:hypothetical protein [Chitinimonas sp.]|uniref:hypothetical protein n=1 Tax=Chitinimonas sp. TaxID=1934313 RepID=UPI002F924226
MYSRLDTVFNSILIVALATVMVLVQLKDPTGVKSHAEKHNARLASLALSARA